MTSEQNKERAMELANKYGRIHLGVDGNAAFALLGPDLQEGESEFVTVNDVPHEKQYVREVVAAKKALLNLYTRLGIGVEDVSFYFGPSHPFGR